MRTSIKQRAGSLRVVRHECGPTYLVLLTGQADASTNGVYEMFGDWPIGQDRTMYRGPVGGLRRVKAAQA